MGDMGDVLARVDFELLDAEDAPQVPGPGPVCEDLPAAEYAGVAAAG